MESYELLIEKFKLEANIKDVDEFIQNHEALEFNNQQLYDQSNVNADYVIIKLFELEDLVNFKLDREFRELD